jgi:hypothetical protein
MVSVSIACLLGAGQQSQVRVEDIVGLPEGDLRRRELCRESGGSLFDHRGMRRGVGQTGLQVSDPCDGLRAGLEIRWAGRGGKLEAEPSRLSSRCLEIGWAGRGGKLEAEPSRLF